MNKLAMLFPVCVCAFAQQTADTIPLRAVLSSNNEVPPASVNASGIGTVWVHVVRDASGQIISGSVDFNVNYAFPGAATITGMHIHPGAAGVNGPVVISSGIAGSSPVTSGSGTGNITAQAQVASSDDAALSALKGLLADPTQYYLNLHTDVDPGGAMRGQLERADMIVLMGVMTPQNEVPATGINAHAAASVVALRTPDSGRVIFDVNCVFPEQVNITGLHIHPGAAGVNGPVVISSGLTGMVQTDASGSGNLHYEAEVDMNNAAAAQALNDLFVKPSNYYINLHTSANPGGAIRDQLHSTDRASFQVNMTPGNEVPAVGGLNASAPATITAYSLRAADGTVPAATVVFDADPRFPPGVQFNGLHLHPGKAGESGPATITGLNGLNPVSFDSGAGNVFRIVTVSNTSGVALLNAALENPEAVYVNLHTKDNPGGAARAQLAAANPALPVVGFAMSSVSDQSRSTVAPGGLMTIFGTTLTKVAGTLGGLEGSVVPTLLNGTDVTIAGRDAPIVTVTPGYAVVQVPVETGTGAQPVIARNSNGASNTYMINVTPAAPAVYFDQVGGILMENSDFSLIRPDHPAHAGDIVVIWSTGLGQTNPPIATGKLATASPLMNTQPVAVTIGGVNADVIYSVAAPGFVGLYQTGVRVPDGVTGSSVPVVVTVGNNGSNTVNIAVQ